MCSWPSGLHFSQRPPDLSQANGVLTTVTVRQHCPRGVTACPSPKATQQLGSGLYLLCPQEPLGAVTWGCHRLPGPRVPCHGRVAKAHSLPLALAQGVTVATGPTPFSVLAVPPPVGPTSQEVTAGQIGPRVAQVQLLSGKGPSQKSAALRPWAPAVALVTSRRLGGLGPRRVGVSTQRARGSQPGPGCGLPLSGGPFRQGGQTIHGSQPLSPWEQHRKKQLFGACPCPRGVPSLPWSSQRLRGLEGAL